MFHCPHLSLGHVFSIFLDGVKLRCLGRGSGSRGEGGSRRRAGGLPPIAAPHFDESLPERRRTEAVEEEVAAVVTEDADHRDAAEYIGHSALDDVDVEVLQHDQGDVVRDGERRVEDGHRQTHLRQPSGLGQSLGVLLRVQLHAFLDLPRDDRVQRAEQDGGQDGPGQEAGAEAAPSAVPVGRRSDVVADERIVLDVVQRRQVDKIGEEDDQKDGEQRSLPAQQGPGSERVADGDQPVDGDGDDDPRAGAERSGDEEVQPGAADRERQLQRPLLPDHDHLDYVGGVGDGQAGEIDRSGSLPHRRSEHRDHRE